MSEKANAGTGCLVRGDTVPAVQGGLVAMTVYHVIAGLSCYENGSAGTGVGEASGGQAPRPSLSLYGAHNSPVWAVSWVDYPDGGREVAAVRVYPGRVVSRQVRRGTGKDRERGARRARREVVRRARYYGLRYMWSFTFPGEGVHDYGVAAGLFAEWMRKHGERWFRGDYLTVLEWHPGGHGWHVHVLSSRRPPLVWLVRVRLSWTRFLMRRGMSPSGGARVIRVHVKDFGSGLAAGKYAGKYVAKDFDRVPAGRRRFRCGYGVRPVERKRGFLRGRVEQVLRQVAAWGRVVWIWWSGADEGWQGPPAVAAEVWRSGEEGRMCS